MSKLTDVRKLAKDFETTQVNDCETDDLDTNFDIPVHLV